MNHPPEINGFTKGTVWEVFSNFYRATVELDGVTYRSVEHAYVAAKTPDPHVRETVRGLEHAWQAKRYGKHRIKIRSDWNDVKIGIMRDLVRQKFTRWVGPKRILMSTTGIYLREGNTYGDKFWGAVWENNQWVGENHLGKILMEIRSELENTCQWEFSNG